MQKPAKKPIYPSMHMDKNGVTSKSMTPQTVVVAAAMAASMGIAGDISVLIVPGRAVR
jgi:hypothetical protein